MKNSLNNPYTISIYLALFTLIARLIVDSFSLDRIIVVYVILLFTLISCYFGVRIYRHSLKVGDPLLYLMEIKAGIRGGAVYALLVGIFTYVFYQLINPNYFPNVIAERAKERIAEMEALNYTQANIDKAMETFYGISEPFTTPAVWASITLFGLVFLSAFYSVIVTAIARKAPKILYI